MIETERLRLRKYTPDDFDALYEILSDPETMQHYPAPFDEERTRNWIRWNLDNYEKYGFGLWAVILKETKEFIGDIPLDKGKVVIVSIICLIVIAAIILGISYLIFKL